MDAPGPVRSIRAWRDRLAGRATFDRTAAEKAIRGAYDACALPAPHQVLWVRGPLEAAQAIAFVESPPAVLRRIVVAVFALGIIIWVALALAIHGSAFATQRPVTALISSATLGAFGLALSSLRPLPLPPGVPLPRSHGRVFILALAVFAFLTGYSFILQRLGGLPDGPVGRAIGIAIAALVGCLPGALFAARLRSAYAKLPRSLYELAPSPSVSSRLERARDEAWAPFSHVVAGPRADRSHIEALQHVYQEAAARHDLRLPLFTRMVRSRQAGRVSSWDVPGWNAGASGRTLYPATIDIVPHYIDGIEDMSRAVAATRKRPTATAAAFADLAFHVDRLYAYRKVAVAVEPPTVVALDAEGRLHAEAGPALAWADGTRLHAWHGHLVAPDVLDQGRPVTLSQINRETDPDRRWILIERFGLGRYLLAAGASEMQHDGYGQLYRLEQRLTEPIIAVRVVNRTPEPDGTYREFWLRVPPAISTARQAVAWTFDMPTDEYEPLAES
jgi:hypothetical protein